MPTGSAGESPDGAVVVVVLTDDVDVVDGVASVVDVDAVDGAEDPDSVGSGATPLPDVALSTSQSAPPLLLPLPDSAISSGDWESDGDPSQRNRATATAKGTIATMAPAGNALLDNGPGWGRRRRCPYRRQPRGARYPASPGRIRLSRGPIREEGGVGELATIEALTVARHSLVPIFPLIFSTTATVRTL